MLTLGFGAHAQEDEGDRLDKVREKGVLRVAVYRDFPPYSYRKEGRYQGIDIDVARALGKHLDLGVELMLLTADESMEDDLRNAVWKGHYLGGGVADVMMHVPVDHGFAEENRQVQIFAPYLTEKVVVAINTQMVAPGTEFMDLSRHSIGVELDTVADHFLSAAYRGRFRSSLRRYRSVDELTEALRSGKVAAVVAPRPQLEHGLGEGTDQFVLGNIPMQGMFRGEWTVGLAVASGNPRLVKSLDEAMVKVRTGGELKHILSAYHIDVDRLAAQ